MKIKFTRQQINTLLALNAVVLVLFCGMFFLPWVNPAAGTDPGGDPIPAESVPHDPNRNPRPGADYKIDWEINMGGSGDETVVAAYPILAGVLIFGNTGSADYDFASKTPGCFVTLIGYNGRPVNFMTYEGTLEAVTPSKYDGFLLCVNKPGACELIETDALGIEIRRSNLKDGENEKIIGVYIDDLGSPDEAPYHAIIEYTHPDTGYKRLRIHLLSEKLELVFKRFFNNTYSMEYLAVYPHLKGFHLFVNLAGAKSSFLAYYDFVGGKDEPKYGELHLDLVPEYTCDGVIPAGDGHFAVLIRTAANVPYFVDFDPSAAGGKDHNIYSLSGAPAAQTSLYTDNDKNYAFVRSSGNLSGMYSFSQNFSGKTELAYFQKFTGLYCLTEIRPYGTLFCGQAADSLSVVGTNNLGVKFESSFTSTKEKICAMIGGEYENSVILVGTSAGKGLNVGGNFGGTDIWAAKLLL